MKALMPYWFWIKWGAVVLAFLLTIRWAIGYGEDKCELRHMKAEQAMLDAAGKRAAALQKKLDNLPKAEGRIREVVRQNPASCDRPKPVADSLREAIRQANAARALPADS